MAIKKSTRSIGKKKSSAKPASKTARGKSGKPAAKTKTAAKSPAAVKSSKTKAAPKGKAKSAPKGKTAKKRPDESYLLASSVVSGILEKKGQNIVCLDLRNIENAVCDYFIICEGTSNIQVEAVADSVEETVKKQLGQRPYRSEGWENALWILIDYVNVVVHVFQRETRQFYNLESLWADAEEVKFDGQNLELRA